MHGRIKLLDKDYDITVTGHSPQYLVQIGDAEPQPAELGIMDSGDYMIRLGEQRAKANIRVKGEMVYIRTLGQTFDLRIVNPVEQAGLSAKGSSNKARSPMPGVVVDVHVAEGERIVKGQSMMTIESMKILTAIAAPRHGKVGKIHFAPGQPFEKGAVLVTLCPEDES
ncbi:MAG: acetyl-CoA carboxylase biotin carboxyl carrier protein subunit [Desulfobacterales bacterium]|nr:MAG: acetyl-CoA carboxylase biotin carboxyl carrier protein subunit [Desulfobacterales bacterium]